MQIITIDMKWISYIQVGIIKAPLHSRQDGGGFNNTNLRCKELMPSRESGFVSKLPD